MTTPTEHLHWHVSSTTLPDADMTVLMWVTEPCGSADWQAGWYTGEGWCYCESGGDVAGDVTHWAEPKGPTQ